jgi:hypothetical protein
MDVIISILPGFSLKLSDFAASRQDYPTSQLQKGFLLLKGDQDLAEEGVGFGVPVLKRGIRTIFPGRIELATRTRGSIQEVTAKYTLNLEEKIGKPGIQSVKSKQVYAIKNFLAATIRRIPWLRGVLTTFSNTLRRIFGWETTFEEAGFCAYVEIIYTIESSSGIMYVEVDTTDLSMDGITEVVVMNEQGACAFDLYRDSGGILLRGKQIGCWDEVTAEWASFVSQSHGLAFTLRQLDGGKIFRGREQIGSRLSWSGFGYSFPTDRAKICYAIRIERL